MEVVSKIRPNIVTDEEAKAKNAEHIKKIQEALENMDSFVLIGKGKNGSTRTFWHVDGLEQAATFLMLLQAQVLRSMGVGNLK